VKRFLFVIICLLCLKPAFAQDTVEKKNWITNSVIERFKVLKTAPDVKVGLYQAFFKRRTLIARGEFTSGIKTGIWTFYDDDGKLNEKFNYDKGEIIYEAPLDTDTNLAFSFDAKIDSATRVTRPIKIGGTYYGMLPYINKFIVPFETDGINMDYFDAVVELLISPGGRLAEYKVHLASKFYKYTQVISLSTALFKEEDKQFIPATLNRQPVLARIFIRCTLNTDGTLEYY